MDKNRNQLAGAAVALALFVAVCALFWNAGGEPAPSSVRNASDTCRPECFTADTGPSQDEQSTDEAQEMLDALYPQWGATVEVSDGAAVVTADALYPKPSNDRVATGLACTVIVDGVDSAITYVRGVPLGHCRG